MKDTCKNCKYYEEESVEYQGKRLFYSLCTLTSISVKPEGKCEYYNKDISQENICYNCKYYGGGNDWGLFCSKHYNHLGRFNDKPCDDFEKEVL